MKNINKERYKMEMKIPRKYQHEYIVCLPGALENQVREEVKGVIFKLLLNKEEKEEALINAMCSKVCDLEDTIRIEYM